MEKRIIKEINRHLHFYFNQKEKDKIWQEIIENTIKDLKEVEKDLLKLRYGSKKKKNIDFITYEIFISRSQYFRILNNILTKIALKAAYHKLIDP